MEKYRIRIGKMIFADPHYLTKLGDSPSYTSLFVNKNPCSWKKRSTAERHLAQIKQIYATAEIESFQAN
jgi:hypothetical protein